MSKDNKDSEEQRKKYIFNCFNHIRDYQNTLNLDKGKGRKIFASTITDMNENEEFKEAVKILIQTQDEMKKIVEEDKQNTENNQKYYQVYKDYVECLSQLRFLNEQNSVYNDYTLKLLSQYGDYSY